MLSSRLVKKVYSDPRTARMRLDQDGIKKAEQSVRNQEIIKR